MNFTVFQKALVDDVLDEKLGFQKQLTRDEAIRFHKGVGLDEQFLGLLLVLPFKLFADFQANVELVRQVREADPDSDYFISLRTLEKAIQIVN